VIEASTDSEWVARCLEALGIRDAIESLPHRRRAAMLARYREPSQRSLRRQHLKGELHDRTDGDS
jgi:hypothetical protein